MTPEDARRLVGEYFQRYHRRSLDETEPSEVPGYWVLKTPCAGGGPGGCRHPLHSFMSLEGGIRHTLLYEEPRRDARGRYLKRHRAWRVLREAHLAQF